MSENLRRSARLAGKQAEEINLGPPEGYLYVLGQGLIIKSTSNNFIGLAAEDVKLGSESILVNFLEEAGNETRFQIFKYESIPAKDIVSTIKVKKEGIYFRITKKQLFDIGNFLGSESEQEVSEAEIPTKRPKSTTSKPPVKRPKGSKTLSQYKKGIGNPNVKAFDSNPMLTDLSADPNFSVSIRMNNLEFHRAALTHNQDLLNKLLNSSYKVSNTNESWSTDCRTTSIERAILAENKEFLIKVLKESNGRYFKRAYMPENGVTAVDTGEVCIQAYGVRTRKVQMSRGGREGNNALIFYSSNSENLNNVYSESFLKNLIFNGVSIEMLTFLITLNPSVENLLGMCVGEAVRSGNHKLALHLITHFNKKGGYGFNFLHEEVLRDGELTSFKKTSVTKKPIENYSVAPLHTACINENTEHLRKLLSNCDDINYMDNEGRKVVHYAAACCSHKPLKVLKEYGCNLSDVDRMKVTPLMISAMYGKADAASYLIKNNVQVNFKSKDGKAAIHYAAIKGHLEVFKVLANGGSKIDTVGVDRKTPLMFAAMYGHYDIVVEILKRGGKDTKKDKCKRSALIFAVKNGHTHIVSLLLSKGSPFDEPDSSKNYPIHYAAAFGWLECLKLLIQAGADINVCNDWKLQPLLISMLQNQTGCVTYLLEKDNIDVNCKDEKGRTLVSRAVDMLNSTSYKQFEYLITVKKADLNILDLNGYSPLHYLCIKSRPVCHLTYLSKKERDEWETELKNIQVNALKLLVEYGCNIDSVNNEGWPPVLYAIRSKNIYLFEVLVEFGADLTISPSGGGIFHQLPSFEVEVLNLCDKLLDRQELIEKFLSCQDEVGYTPILKFVEYFSSTYSNRYNQIYNEFSREMQAEINKKNEIIKKEQEELELKRIEEINRQKCLEDEKAQDDMLVDKKNENSSSLTPGFSFATSLNQPSNPTTSAFGQSGSIFGQTASNLNQPTSLFGQSSSIFGQTSLASNQPGFSFGQPNLISNQTVSFQSPQSSLNAYLTPSASPYLTLDYTLLNLQAKEASEKECDHYILILKKLIEKGANIHDTVGKLKQYRETPLTDELSSNYFIDFDNTKRLKEYGPKGLQSALHLIANCNYQKLFDFIMSFKLDINHQDFSRNSVILFFYMNNSIFTSDLIDLGGDINIPNANGEVLLQKLIESDSKIMIDKIIEKGANLNIHVSNGRTLLNLAVERKNMQLIRKLLENGADPNFPDKQNRTALHIAFNQAEPTANASFDMESLLLLYKADINAKDSQLRTPLHYCFVKLASPDNNQPIDPIESVSSACALKIIDVNVQDVFKKTPLHYAAKCSAITSTMFLLSKGAQLEVEDIHGNTPLAIAIKEGHSNYAVMLVQQSANVNKNVFIEQTSSYYNCNYSYTYNQYNRLRTPGTYSMFKAAIIQEWQGLAYLLIFNGYPYMLAMQDSMTQNKFQLVKTLLAKVADNSQLQQVNKEGQNLFHSLAIYGNQAGQDITAIICEQLIERGVCLNVVDCYGRSPLHYATKNGYVFFISILLERGVPFTEKDDIGLTPIGYAIQGSKILSCLNILSMFAMYNADFSFKIVENGITLTPLLHAIKSRADRSLIRFFLDHGASLQETDSLGQNAFIYAVLNDDFELAKALILEGTLNLRQSDASGKTALIYAVLNNNTDIAKLIIQSRSADLTQCDNDGRNALHYAVQPLPYGSYENEELVTILLEFHPSPLSPDSKGETILTLAQRQHSGKLLKLINSYLLKKFNTPETPLIERKISFYESIEDEIDFCQDAEEYVNMQNDIENVNLAERKPDVNGGFSEYFSVVDEFDLIMTKVDLSYGPYSAYVFYRMQLLKDNNRGVFVLFTRWGRIGETGAFQRTPFSDEEEAVKEFSKVFKAKTGNEWGEPFVKKIGKYVPMKYAKTRVKYRDFITEFTYEINPKSELPCKLLEAIKEFTSQNMFRSYFRELSLDGDIMNFSNLSRDSINEAEQILYNISKVAELLKLESETDKKIELITNIQELTSRYYELIPIIQDMNSAVPPIIAENDIKANIDKIFLLKDLEIASKLILGALYRQRTCNPYDYIYKSLRVNLEILDQSSEEFQLLFKYAQSGGCANYQMSIFKVKRKGEIERIQKFKHVKNRKLLWHGTKSANISSILLQGLKIAPPEVPNTGYMFGKGVYFADVFSKSLGYCSHSGSNNYFMLLCEVVLGEMKESNTAMFIDKLPDEYLSTKGNGRYFPDPKQSVFTPYGVEVPAGKLTSIPNYYGYGLSYNEFIVYDTSQIRIRYLVHLKNQY